MIIVSSAVFFTLSVDGNNSKIAKTRITIAGSTSVQPYIGLISEEYEKKFMSVTVNVQGGGSSNGIKAVIDGTADIGMSSRALKPDEAEKLDYIVIARDGLVLITHKDNPVDRLSIEQVRGIYSGKITDWGEVGGESGRAFHLFTREAGSGTRMVFEEEIMTFTNEEGEEIVLTITAESMVLNSNGAIKAMVSGDLNALGFISLGMVDDTVRGLQLDGVAPTLENVNKGVYRLYREFLLVLNPQISYSDSNAINDFINFILSEDGREILVNESLVPVAAVHCH